MVTEKDIWQYMEEVADPEIPVISVIDLGVVRKIELIDQESVNVTITPTYSVCTDHGYVFGKQDVCPICQKPLEIYSRVSGYYRNLEDWNEGKQKEFSRRKTYSI